MGRILSVYENSRKNKSLVTSASSRHGIVLGMHSVLLHLGISPVWWWSGAELTSGYSSLLAVATELATLHVRASSGKHAFAMGSCFF